MQIGVSVKPSDADGHICATLVNEQGANTRLRVPCSSVRGRAVFVKQVKKSQLLKLSEVEVYVRREYDSMNKQQVLSRMHNLHTGGICFSINIVTYLLWFTLIMLITSSVAK